ncbi:hypothetical protein [Bacillus cereus]|uniref:Uncharacterized protein n=1 Tax=Bacillus cereus (strain VD014) TaxID=1053223 RepID=A0A9W5K7D4_BACC8|nr:hypothetical protein [Bacillus cereus]EJR22355.1 hypothetical protein IIA_02390 [Bacillus cereus VD014]
MLYGEKLHKEISKLVDDIENGAKSRPDLIGQAGTIIRNIEIIDATESEHGVSVRVSDNVGEVYWTDLQDVELD